MRPYKVLITHEALFLSRPAVQDRQKILSFLDSLCSNPFQVDEVKCTLIIVPMAKCSRIDLRPEDKGHSFGLGES